MYGDFDNTNPVAIEQLALELRQLGQFSKTPPNHQDRSETVSTPQSNEDGVNPTNSNRINIANQSIPLPVATPGINHTEIDNSTQRLTTSSSRQSTLVDCRPFSSIITQQCYFQLCVNTGEHTISLAEIDLTKVQSDSQLFQKIWRKYCDIRGHGIRRCFLKPTDVHFVHVSLQPHKQTFRISVANNLC
jgi:hypothetical protein